jgi:hypothetical protein
LFWLKSNNKLQFKYLKNKMVNENKKLAQGANIKKFETVYELKNDYQVPSYEEFMKNYNGERVNYADLNSGDIGSSKGYGPTYKGAGWKYDQNSHFRYLIEINDSMGKHWYDTLWCADISELRYYLRKLENGTVRIVYIYAPGDFRRAEHEEEKLKEYLREEIGKAERGEEGGTIVEHLNQR